MYNVSSPPGENIVGNRQGRRNFTQEESESEVGKPSLSRGIVWRPRKLIITTRIELNINVNAPNSTNPQKASTVPPCVPTSSYTQTLSATMT